ncbi:Osmotic growth protein [Saitoella coloradoensis]
MSSNTHVIVVGGGLSGLSACHTILERGGSVLLLEKMPFCGGNSTKATSGINGALTRTQIELGIRDSVQQFYADTLKSARDLARPDLIKVLTYKSASAVEWLQDSFGLDLSLVARLGGHSQPRTHRGKEMFPGMTITYALMEKLEEIAENEPTRARILKKAKVYKLIKEDDKVVGVKYEHEGKQLEERGPVVLATGGYAADFGEDSLLKKFRPDIIDLSTTNGISSTGDGHKMVMDPSIGGKGIDMEKVQVHPTGLIDPKDPNAKVKFLAAEALRGVGGLLLDADGKRFVDELQHRDFVTNEMWKNKFPIRLILNGKASKEIEWHCKHYVGRGLMKRFNSGQEVAAEMGIEAEVLAQTFAEYNTYASGEKPDPFKKKFFQNAPVEMEDETFHVALMQPVLHYTMGGIEINDIGQILSSSTPPAPIEGLFACGELAGGVHGANRLGGSSLLGCVVYGRVAGDSASKYLMGKLIEGKGAEGASGRLGMVGSHLIDSRVRIDPVSKKVSIDFMWGDDNQSSSPSTGSGSGQQSSEPKGESSGFAVTGQDSTPATVKKPAKGMQIPDATYTLSDIAKHNTESDIWVTVNGLVLDVTNFLDEHPGGAKAILLYAGRDATEEFNMLHDKNVVEKYAPDTCVGRLKE